MNFYNQYHEGSLAPNAKVEERRNQRRKEKRAAFKRDDPEGYERFLQSERERRCYNTQSYRDAHRKGDEERITHTDDWLFVERAELEAYPPVRVKRPRSNGRMAPTWDINPELACILRARVLDSTGLRI